MKAPAADPAVLASPDMRGPILSGPLGSASTLEAIGRALGTAGTVVVIGPLWLGEVLSASVRVLVLTEGQERARARRAVRRAAKTVTHGKTTPGHGLTVALAGDDLPIRAGTVDALLIDGASTLDVDALARWMATLVPAVRPGGRLIAIDATDDPAAEAKLAGLFLAAALGEIGQVRPRVGVVLTAGTAPPAPVITTRFADTGTLGAPATVRD
jgi:hypothetical protein